MIHVDQLHELLRPDFHSGRLFWRVRPLKFFTDGKYPAKQNAYAWNSRYAGKEAFTADNGRGYKVGGIFNQQYYAHRVLWAMHEGAWPAEQIDHINGIRDDNRLINLRAVSRTENNRNASQSQENTMTKKIDNGGPAFPRSQSTYTCAQDGMSLRDHFAGLYMQGIAASGKIVHYELHSLRAYIMADAMIAARKTGAED